MIPRAGENIEYLRIIVDNTIELYKLKGIEALSRIFSKLIMASFFVISIASTFLFITLFITVAIGQSTGNWMLAILCGAGVNLIVGLIVFFRREQFILKPLMNFLIDEYIE